MTITAKDENVLTPMTLNNYLVSMREGVRQARVHLIHHHTRRIKTLSKSTGKKKTNAPDKELASTLEEPEGKSKLHEAKNKKKSQQFSKEIKAVKSFTDEDLSKLVLLNNKTFNLAARDGSSGGVRAVCRLAEHAALVKCKRNFQDRFGDTVKDLPYCIKVVGTKQQYKKVRKMAKQGKKEQYQQTQRFYSKLLRQVGGAEFAFAEDLYSKLKKSKEARKQKDKQATGKSSDKSNAERKKDGKELQQTIHTDDSEEDEADEEGDAENGDAAAAPQDELRSKIFKLIDAQCGKMDDDGLDDDSDYSDVDEDEDNVSLDGDITDDECEERDSDDLLSTTNKILETSQQIKLSTKSDTVLNSIKNITGKRSLVERSNSPSAEIPLSNSRKDIKHTHDSAARHVTPLSKPSNKKNGKKNTGVVKDNVLANSLGSDNTSEDKQKSTSASTSFKAYEVKQIDLAKAKRSHTVIPLVSKKRVLESNIDELPSGIGKKKMKLQKKSSESGKQQRSKVSFFQGKEEESSEDEEESSEQSNYEARREVGAGRGGRGGSREFSGGRGGRGGPSGGMGGSRGGMGGPRGGMGGSRDGMGADRGSSSRRGTDSGNPALSTERSNQRGRGGSSGGSLHPSWEAKKQQAALSSISVFQGKKTIFE